MKALAPIVVFCYNRPQHLQRTLESLAANPLAADSDLFVYSDGPRTPQDAENVQVIRTYLACLTGFRSVEVKASAKNKGLAGSVIDGVSEVINRFGRAIVMEDDLLCTVDFLQYMNAGLGIYEENPLVMSISGYSFGLSALPNYTEDTALVLRASSYGWATWKSRWAQVDWQVSDFDTFIGSSQCRDRLKDAGEDILPMIVKQQKGLINSWAVRWTYHHVKAGGYCLVPVRSKIRNIGNDGSGSNPVATTLSKDLTFGAGPIHFNPEVSPDPDVITFIRNRNRPSLLRRCINFIRFKIW